MKDFNLEESTTRKGILCRITQMRLTVLANERTFRYKSKQGPIL